jgi:hypothetical protein
MRLIYRHFFNVGDRINYVSKARRTMESRGIRHDLGRYDRQRVREHFSFAPLRRKYESLLEEAARRRRARGMRSARERGLGFDGQLARMQLKCSLPFAMASGFFTLRAQAGQWVVAANFPSSAFALISIASAVMAVGTLTRQPPGNALLPNISSLVGEGNVDGARKLISKALSAPCGGQGGASAERRANPRFIVTSLAREAVAAQELYETI